MTTALFLVPGQYKDSSMFLNVARDLRKNYYGKDKSVIFQALWDGSDSSDPTFAPVDDIPSAFSLSFWDSLDASDVFMPICHCGTRDGPMIGPEGEQPWPTDDNAGLRLTDDSAQFWRQISWSVGSGGKILLAGCDTAVFYGPLVAALMPMVSVYGFAQHISTGVLSTSHQYIVGYFMKGRVGANVTKC